MLLRQMLQMRQMLRLSKQRRGVRQRRGRRRHEGAQEPCHLPLAARPVPSAPDRHFRWAAARQDRSEQPRGLLQADRRVVVVVLLLRCRIVVERRVPHAVPPELDPPPTTPPFGALFLSSPRTRATAAAALFQEPDEAGFVHPTAAAATLLLPGPDINDDGAHGAGGGWKNCTLFLRDDLAL
jgi:hypothetical protein